MKEYIAFELLENEVDFIKPQLIEFRRRFKKIPILLLVAADDSKEKILRDYPELDSIGRFYLRKKLEKQKYPFVRVFITSEQYSNGIEHIQSYCSFHGHPSKGLTLMHGANKNFNGFFTLGAFQKEFITDFFAYHKYLKAPLLYDVGYPKSDSVINGCANVDKAKELASFGMSNFPTVLYAPAFNEYGSMRESGFEIVKTLLESTKRNVIVKLAVDCWKPQDYLYANGGVDWFGEFERRFGDNPRFFLYKKRGIDPLLPIADVLVTCVSSVSFEFFVLGKPVIFVDTPKFFSKYLKRYFPNEDTASWKNNSFINAGREYGRVVQDISKELNRAVDEALAEGYSKENEIRMREKLLFNPGTATEETVKLLKKLYDANGMSYIKKIKSFALYIYSEHIKASGFCTLLQCVFKNTKSCFIKKKEPKRTYIHCENTLKAAESQGLNLNDYLEQNENTPLKIGHRKRILEQMERFGLLKIEGKNVLEIGAGTARFLEKVIQYKPRVYVVYETDEAWSSYIEATYKKEDATKLIVNAANGKSLNKTRNESIDFVYAHAVFVYLPFVTAVGYLKEIARVCKPGALVCLDWYYDTDWNMGVIEANEQVGYRWPVVVSRKLLEDCYSELGFTVVGEFTEIYSCSYSRYVVLKKAIKG